MNTCSNIYLSCFKCKNFWKFYATRTSLMYTIDFQY